MTRLRWLAPVVLLLACGDDGGGADPGPDAGCRDITEPPAQIGMYATLEEFDLSACQPGSLAGFVPEGMWYVEEQSRTNFYGVGPVRLERQCDGLAVRQGWVFATGRAGDSMLTDDVLYWRHRVTYGGDLTLTDAYAFCGLDADGNLTGRVAHCSEGRGLPECYEEAVTLVPFGRLPGEAEAEGLELVGEIGASWPQAFTANVRVYENRAYLVRGSDGLRIVDISDPSAPRDISRFPATGDFFNDVKLVEAGGDLYALIASAAAGILVVDVTNPEDPVQVSNFTPSGQAQYGVHTLFVEESDGVVLVYLADGLSDLLSIWDVTDPRNPRPWARHHLGDERWDIHDLYVEGRRAYLNATTRGLVVVDAVESPGASVEVGRYSSGDPNEFSHSSWVTTAGGRRVAVTGDEGYGAHLEVVDVDPASPTFLERLGSFQTRPQASVHNIMAFGERAYVAWYQDGVRILDLSDPSAPAPLAYFNTWRPEASSAAMFEGAVGLDVDLERRLIFVADTPRGLLILRDLTAQ